MFGGVVRLRVVVDTTGRPRMSTLDVHESSHELLTNAVKHTIPRWRFSPARRETRLVEDTVEHVFEFVPPSTRALLQVPPSLLSPQAFEAGRWRLVIGGPVIVPNAGPVADSRHIAIAAAAVDTLLASLPVHPAYQARIACLALGMSGTPVQPPLTLLRALSRPTYTVVAAKRCPPTFGSPFRYSTEPDPPGEDPWIFTPLVPRAVNDSMVIIDIAMRHATTSGTYDCVAHRDTTRAGGWRAACRKGQMWVH